uniref:Uncharacterized protein n=1 Tax=Arundo donax TaxID=35708 RepID=A0A0A9GCN7_ARUDO
MEWGIYVHIAPVTLLLLTNLFCMYFLHVFSSVYFFKQVITFYIIFMFPHKQL